MKDSAGKTDGEKVSRQQWPILRWFVLSGRLLARNASIVILFFLVVGYNWALNNADLLDAQLSDEWLFEEFPKLAISLLAQPEFWLLVGILFLAQAVLGVAVSIDLFYIFSRNRRGLLASLKEIRFGMVNWFLEVALLTHGVFALVGSVVWGIAHAMQPALGIGATLLVGSGFILLYPLFYLILSVASLVAVLPLGRAARWEKLRILTKPKILWTFYWFYLLRLGAEFLLLLFLPWASVAILESKVLASIFVVAGLTLPFAWLRGSAYELKLEAFQEDQDFRHHFESHYRELLPYSKV